jgi:hypothetical protein
LCDGRQSSNSRTGHLKGVPARYTPRVLVAPIFWQLPTAQLFATKGEDVIVTITRDLAADRKGRQPIQYFPPPVLLRRGAFVVDTP